MIQLTSDSDHSEYLSKYERIYEYFPDLEQVRDLISQLVFRFPKLWINRDNIQLLSLSRGAELYPGIEINYRVKNIYIYTVSNSYRYSFNELDNFRQTFEHVANLLLI